MIVNKRFSSTAEKIEIVAQRTKTDQEEENGQTMDENGRALRKKLSITALSVKRA
jgi:hypothetical protein